jgi:hypothetical protein
MGLYARLAAEDRFDRGYHARIGSLLFRPGVEFFRCYVLKRGLLDGSVGFTVAAFHAWSYFLRAAYLLERERNHAGGKRKLTLAPDRLGAAVDEKPRA